MELVENEVFESVAVTVDGRSFSRCTLTNCELRYSGGAFTMIDTLVTDCTWAFAGPARRTMEVLQMFNVLEGRERDPMTDSPSESGLGLIN